MKPYLYFLMILTVTLFSCDKIVIDPENEKEEEENKGFVSLTIKTNLLNPEEKDTAYLVYLIDPGLLDKEPGDATQSGFYGPFQTDAKGEVFIDIKTAYDLHYYIESAANHKMAIVVCTTEDIYLRNPLNEAMELSFVANEDADTKFLYPYLSPVESITVDFTDKYPDGVLSLAYQDATFVIKLEFDKNFQKDNSYEVSIFKRDGNMPNNIGNVRIGRICRAFQYYDTPFFKADNLAQWNGFIIVKKFDNNENVNYEGYPMEVSFDVEGKCIQGDIIRVKLKN